jgi:hypothetical protein
MAGAIRARAAHERPADRDRAHLPEGWVRLARPEGFEPPTV